jgi:hypothetical protein
MIGGVLLEAVLLHVTLRITMLAVMTLETSVDVLKTRQENIRSVNSGDILGRSISILIENDKIEIKIPDEVNNHGYKIYFYNLNGNKIDESSKINEFINVSHFKGGFYLCIIEKNGVFVKSEKILIH